MTDSKIDAMQRAARIIRGMAMAFDEAPAQMVSRGEVAKTLTDIAEELERQATQHLEEDDLHPGEMEGGAPSDEDADEVNKS